MESSCFQDPNRAFVGEMRGVDQVTRVLTPAKKQDYKYLQHC